MDDPAYLAIPYAAAFGVVAAICAPLSHMMAGDRGRSPWWTLLGLVGGVLGPLALRLLGPLPGSPMTLHPRKLFSFKAAAVAVLVGTLIVGLAVALGLLGFDRRGEALQGFILGGLIFGGLLSGLCAAVVSRRVAFFETLVLDWVLLLALVLIGSRIQLAFTYGTTPVYYAVVLLAAFLILEVSRVLGGSLGFMISGDGRLSFKFGYEAWVGRRYLMAKRRSSFISVITVISIGGVAVGVWAMLVVLSVMSGFMADLRGKILGANAHVIVMRYGIDFTEYDDVMEKLRGVKGIVGASPFVLNEVMVSSDVNLSGAIIKGIVPATASSVSDLERNMTQGSLANLSHPDQVEASKPGASSRPNGAPGPAGEEERGGAADDDLDALLELGAAGAPGSTASLPGIIVGQELARSLKVFLGDPVNVVSPVGELGPTGPVPKARTFRVVGVFYSGMYEYDAKFVYVRLDEAQDFFSTKGAVTGIELKVDDIEATTPISRDILRTLGGYPYRTKDWKEMNRNLFSALKLEKIAMFIILTFIILVASFNILATLIMVVIEKGKEISILKSMGVSDSSIMKIFVVYGVVIGGFGTILGVALGAVTCLAIRNFGVGLDPEVYYISELPVRMNPIEFAVVAVAAVVISYLATLIPSLHAARLHPVDGLRYD